MFSFGTSNANTTPKPGGFQLGSTPTSAFGAPVATPSTGFSLGTFGTSNAPAPTFGINAPVQTFGFGSTIPISTPGTNMFGAVPSSLGTTSGLAYGATPASTAMAPSFGAPASGTLSFGTLGGTPASTAVAPSFGASSGGAFGTLGAAPTSTTGALSFGAPATSALSFGMLGSAPASTATAPSFAASSGGLTFGAQPTGPPPGAAMSFQPASTVNTAPFSLTSALRTSAATSRPSYGVNFGPTSLAGDSSLSGIASRAPLSLSFATPLTATSAAGTGGLGLGTIGTTSTPLSFALGPALSAPTATSATEKVGLGGIATSSHSSGTASTTTQKELPPREQQIPNEIQQDVENFKNYIKQQKLYSSDVARCSVKDFREVESQIVQIQNVVKEVESQLQRNRSLAEKLKYDTAHGLQLIEMGQRTQDTPPGLQYENTAPLQYFLHLADHFEKEMNSLKIQIENTDKYVKNFGQPATLTSQDLCMGMKRLHGTFVALAGHLQSVHTQVESQKEFYLNLRKHLANDNSNPFEKLDRQLSINQSSIRQLTFKSPPKIACGPTPFNNVTISTNNFPMTSQQQGQPPPYPGGSTGFGGFSFGNQSFGSQPSTTPLTDTTFGGFNKPATPGFQLQKPPSGTKRGKQ